jgi:hypothetical protein
LHGDNDTDVPHQQSVAMAAELSARASFTRFSRSREAGTGFDGRGMQDAGVSAAFDKIEMFLKQHLGK